MDAGIKTKKEQPEKAATTRYKVKSSGKGLEKLTLLQWNADAYLSKKEEFSQFILEHKVDIYHIQETKMTVNDARTTHPRIYGLPTGPKPEEGEGKEPWRRIDNWLQRHHPMPCS